MDNVKQPLGIEVQNIECSQICFSGASMSQVVDRFVHLKIQTKGLRKYRQVFNNIPSGIISDLNSLIHTRQFIKCIET